MSYAANLGRDRIIAMLHEEGATDLTYAFDRACLQGQLETARRLRAMGAKLRPGAVMGPCETLNGAGLQFLLELGASLADEHGDPLAPIGLILETYSRNREGKHRCLELAAAHGVALPDTAPMAVHRGRLDLLAAIAARDPGVLNRPFSHDEIYPRALGCHEDQSLALGGTPVADTPLLHLAVDQDDVATVEWLLDHDADVNGRGAVDPEGFGGHTALFGCVMSQPFRCAERRDDGLARVLLDRGADPNVRTSLRKRLRFVDDESMHEYRDVTPLSWGERFHDQAWINRSAMRLIAERGGVE